MNKLLVESLEGKFNYKLMAALKKETMLSQSDFTEFYNAIATQLDEKYHKYIFTSTMKAVLRFVERSQNYNSAIINQFISNIIVTNPYLTLEVTDCFRVMLRGTAYTGSGTPAEYLEKFNEIYNAYKAASVIENRNVIMEYTCLSTLTGMLAVDYIVEEEVAAEVFDLKQAVSKENEQIAFELRLNGSFIW